MSERDSTGRPQLKLEENELDCYFQRLCILSAQDKRREKEAAVLLAKEEQKRTVPLDDETKWRWKAEKAQAFLKVTSAKLVRYIELARCSFEDFLRKYEARKLLGRPAGGIV